LGSVREVLTLAGAISSVIACDAFGNILSESNLSTSGNCLFTGLLYWRADGMYGTPNRELLPSLGKWLQEDLIGFEAGDANLGRYAGNNGTNLTDLRVGDARATQSK
jgi:RHS repeat-associated protein